MQAVNGTAAYRKVLAPIDFSQSVVVRKPKPKKKAKAKKRSR